jgi:hypothetical protein
VLCSRLVHSSVSNCVTMFSFCAETKDVTLGRCVLFSGITQRLIVILYRRFGAAYRSHLQGSGSPRRSKKKLFLDFLTLEDGTDMLSRNVGKGLPLNAA